MTKIEFDKTDVKLIMEATNKVIDVLKRHDIKHSELILKTIIKTIQKSITEE